MTRILVTGSTGFIGQRLVCALDRAGYQIRCLVRTGEKWIVPSCLRQKPEIVYGDLLVPKTLGPALKGISLAYYLVHSMGGRSLSQTRAFADLDRKAAYNFIAAADAQSVARIIYLGGLGDVNDDLSPHLRSRQEVAEILGSGKVHTTVLRAAVIIGAGGASFEIIRHLVERLPVMICPRWVYTRSQPIYVDNVIQYLTGCIETPATVGQTLDIGGEQIMSYADLMKLYAKVRGLFRLLFGVPVFTPRLSAYWVNLVTPVPAGIVMPLAEGLKNEAVCRDNRIREMIPLDLFSMENAICEALNQIQKGPGRLASLQSCLLPANKQVNKADSLNS